MGAGNAFITPLLIAGLSEIIDQERLGRAVGVYRACLCVEIWVLTERPDFFVGW